MGLVTRRRTSQRMTCIPGDLGEEEEEAMKGEAVASMELGVVGTDRLVATGLLLPMTMELLRTTTKGQTMGGTRLGVRLGILDTNMF